MLTEVPLERLPSFPFEAMFKHLGLRKKGSTEEQDEYVMVQLEIGYHCVRNRLFTFALTLAEAILTRKDFNHYARELLCVLAASLCQKMRGEVLQEFVTWFTVMLFVDIERAFSALKTVAELEEGDLAEFVETKCQPSDFNKSKLFKEDVEFFQLTKVADEMDLGQQETPYLLVLNLMFVEPEFSTYLAVKLSEVKIPKLVELTERLEPLVVPNLLYRYIVLALYIKLLYQFQPQLIVNWQYFL